MHLSVWQAVVTGTLICLAACRDSTSLDPDPADVELRAALARAGVRSVTPPSSDPPAMVELGRVLFFDKILSGNKDIACSGCHHLAYRSTDGLSLSIGTGGRGFGPGRQLGNGAFQPRNTAGIHNRGLPQLTTLFHDGRLEFSGGQIRSPAGNQLPAGFASPVDAQAMFPVMARGEMRGRAGDSTRFGEPNELALLDDQDFTGVWAALMGRLLAIPEYRGLFLVAFPGVDSAALGFEHASRAMAAFERGAFTLLNSPFDRYLAGESSALSDSARRGALLFYGRARCAVCHTGPLLTDQKFHNIGIPQLGPGFDSTDLDLGRARVTGNQADRFAFRTPPLRNVLLTGPWMHDGAYTTIQDAVRHYRNPAMALQSYDGASLDPRLRPLLHNDPGTASLVLATMDPLVRNPVVLSDEDVALLVEFLRALTDHAAFNQLREIPSRVPSGLPVFE